MVKPPQEPNKFQKAGQQMNAGARKFNGKAPTVEDSVQKMKGGKR